MAWLKRLTLALVLLFPGSAGAAAHAHLDEIAPLTSSPSADGEFQA